MAALGALALAGGGCFEEIPDPTQGFVAVETGDVAGAEVFVDDASAGVVTTVGPVDAGDHVVRVHRAGYLSDPAERTVRVERARTARTSFALTPAFTGSVRVSAMDEVRGTEVTGAEILADVGSGFAPTGVTSPGTVTGLPPGTVRVQLRRDGFADSDPIDVDVAVGETADLAVELGPSRAVLAEMLTYVGCPNCPAAAEHLDGLRTARPNGVFVLEWHTVSRLPLYDSRWVARELYYGGGPSVGYPATVFQGEADSLIVGSDASDLADFDSQTEAALGACRNDCPVALVVDGSIGSGTAAVTVRVKWRGGSLPANLVLRTVLYEDDVIVGPSSFGFVAREMNEQSLTLSTAGTVVPVDVTLPVSGTWVHDHLAVVAFVQSDPPAGTREILAVGGLP